MALPRTISTPHYRAKLLCALSIFLLLLTTPACAQSVGKDYFPLSDGARWEYTGRLSTPKGQFNIPASIHIDGETIIRGRHYFKYVIESDLSAMMKAPRQTQEVRYYRTAADGIYFLPGKDTEGEELLEMPLPAPTGARWLSGTSEVRAESAGTVSAGGREYADCLKITYSGADGVKRTEYELAPGVGIVRGVYVDVVGPGTSLELTLANYRL
jgi:hypothetical protein